MSSIWDAFKDGASQGLRDGGAGIVVRGVEAALEDEEVRAATVEAVAGGVREATAAVVGNIRRDFDGITENLGTGLNPDNYGLWSALKDRLVNGSRGIRRLGRLGLAGMLWGGITVASYVGVGIVRTSGLNRDANVRGTAVSLRRAIAGAIKPEPSVDRDALNAAADYITGFEPPAEEDEEDAGGDH